jgi:anti-anti-sigma factor
MPGAELKTSVRDDYVVVALRGDLDITGAADAEAAITALMTWGQILIIDMSALDFIDCASLGVLLRVQRLAWSMQRNVLRLLALADKDQAFWVHASVHAAVTARLNHGARAAECTG